MSTVWNIAEISSGTRGEITGTWQTEKSEYKKSPFALHLIAVKEISFEMFLSYGNIYKAEICLHEFISSSMHFNFLGRKQKAQCFPVHLRYEKTSTVNGSAAETILCFRKCYYGELKWFLTLKLCNNVNTSPLWDCPLIMIILCAAS